MPYGSRYKRRSYRPKRRYYTGKKYFNKRKYSKTNTPKRLSDKSMYAFKRTYQYPNPITGPIAGSFTSGSFQHALSDVPNYTEFTTLYDNFKITGIQLKFYPRLTDQTSPGTSYGQFIWCTDYDDATAPTGVNELLQRQSTKVYIPVGNRPLKFFYRPRAASAVYNGTGFTAYAQTSQNTWVDCNNAGVPFYGSKWVWTGTSAAYQMDVYATYYFKFKAPR